MGWERLSAYPRNTLYWAWAAGAKAIPTTTSVTANASLYGKHGRTPAALIGIISAVRPAVSALLRMISLATFINPPT
jgi:hypothetical protein